MNTGTYGGKTLNRAERRLLRKTIQKVKGIYSSVQMKKYLGTIHKMKKSRAKAIILLAASSKKIIKAKLGLERGEWQLLAQSRSMREAIFANTLGFFTPAFLLLPEWKTANDKFNDALVAIENHVDGGKGLKETALFNVNVILKKALAYVNGLCLDSQTTAVSIIGAALMLETNTKGRIVGPITVKQGNGTGILTCSCPAPLENNHPVRTTYEKGYSTDGGKTWTDLQPIPGVKSIASGLTIGLPYVFRSRYYTVKGGLTAYVYSQPVFVM
jgi:hypothetical protein